MMSQDYLVLLEPFLKELKPKAVLEFGLGEGSVPLRQLCDSLVSIELYCYDAHNGWFDRVKELFKGDAGWTGELYLCEKDEHTEDVKQYIDRVLNEYKPDFVFVDPGVHFRPEIVNQCFNKVDHVGNLFRESG